MAKTLIEKLCKKDWKYSVFCLLWAAPNHTRYYRNIHIIGKENIPQKGPLIFAPNHQNALMDAMAVISTQKHQVVFVARADIFKKPIVIKMLNLLRILPIFRKRDGGNSFDNNQETFDIIDNVLRSGLAFGILPEGIFNPFKRLGTLQKGIFRIALKAQEAYGETGGVQIVPVGLNWQNPRAFFKDVTIVYGKPIAIADYFPQYLENPAKAYLQLQEKLSEEMRRLMIDIRNETYYETIEGFRSTFGYDYAEAMQRNPNNPMERLQSEQDLVKKLEHIAEQNESQMTVLEQTFSQYRCGLEKLKIRSWLLRNPKVPWFELVEDFGVLILGLPFACFGYILGFLPLMLAKKCEKIIADTQFLSSTRYVVSLAVRGIQNLTLITMALLTYNNIIQLLCTLALILFAERLMLFYSEHYRRTLGKFRYFRLLKNQNALLRELREQRNRMLEMI